MMINQARPPAGMSRVVRIAVKAAITLGLLAVLARGTDFDAVKASAGNLSGFTMCMSIAVLLALSVVQASRWQAILRALGKQIRYRLLWNIVLIGFFFSQLLPTSIGGDIARVWKLHQAGVPATRALNSVLMDRVTALIAAALITALGALLMPAVFPDGTARYVLACAAGGMGAGLLILVMSRFPAADKGLKRLIGRRLGDWMSGVLADAYEVLLRPRTLAVATTLSCFIHITVSATVWMIARDVGADVGLLTCVVLVPLVILVSMLPISIAGWGVREGAMIVALGSVGVDRATALTTSLLFGLAIAATGIPGGLLWLYGRRHPVQTP